MVIISSAAKAPLSKFMCWLQKHAKIHREKQAAAAREGTTYLGHTPLSMLVAYKGQELRDEIVALIQNENDPAAFGTVWAVLPTHLANDARKLIVTVVLVLPAS